MVSDPHGQATGADPGAARQTPKNLSEIFLRRCRSEVFSFDVFSERVEKRPRNTI